MSDEDGDLPEIDLVEGLEYMAEHPKMCTKAEMAAMLKQAAEELRDTRELIALHEAVGLANADPKGNA